MPEPFASLCINSIKDEHIGRSVKAKRKERTYDI